MLRQLSFLFEPLFLLTIALAPSQALAILADEESSALERTFKTYQRANSTFDLLERLKSSLDLDTFLFLSKKARITKNLSLPKLTVHKNSRISFNYKSRRFKVDFISLRSELIVVNGTEVEFMFNDSNEVRFQKLYNALNRSNASTHPILRFLDATPEQANARSPKPRVPSPADASLELEKRSARNLASVATQLATLITAITAAANYDSFCGLPNLSTVEKCDSIYGTLDTDPLSPERDAIDKEIPPCLEDVSKVERLDPNHSAIKDAESRWDVLLKTSENLAKNKANEYIPNETMLAKKKEERNLYVKARIQVLSDQVIRFKDSAKQKDDSSLLCKEKVRACVIQILLVVRKRFRNDNDLVCFAKKMSDEIKQSTPTQQGGSIQGPNGPGGKAQP
jgi:hypothetical protein